MFEKGKSGNPGGRPRGFAQLIRERTGLRGERLVELARQIMNGDVAITPSQQRMLELRAKAGDSSKLPELMVLVEKMNMPTIKERQDAIKFLAEHGHGKPQEFVEVTGEGGGPLEFAAMDLTRLSVEELQAWRLLVQKAGAGVLPPGSSGVLAEPLPEPVGEP